MNTSILVKNMAWEKIVIAIIVLLIPTAEAGPPRTPTEGITFSDQESDRAYPKYPSKLNDLSGTSDLDAHREVSESDREYILTISDYLIDKRYEYGNRERAARHLGIYGHSLAIPALLAVIRDESDNIRVRMRAILALGRIRDKRNVMYLVEDGFGSGNNHLILSTRDALAGSISDVPDELKDVSYYGGFRPPPGSKIGIGATPEEIATPLDPEKLKPYLDIWREWWKKNHEDVTFGRRMGMP